MDNENEIIQKQCRDLGCPTLIDVLTQAPWRELQPILIKALRDRNASKNPHALLAEYESKKPFYGESEIDQREMHRFAGHFFESLPSAYRAVELSPITPLGLNAILSAISQDVTLATTRASEVVSDPTTPLALTCACLRRDLLPQEETRSHTVRLATLHRTLRLQPFDKSKGYTQHFRLFGLCSGGRNIAGTRGIHAEALREHISIWLALIERLSTADSNIDGVEVVFSDIRATEAILDHLKIPREAVYKRALDETFDFFREFSVDLPRTTDSIREISDVQLQEAGLLSLKNNFITMEESILTPLRAQYPGIRFHFDLSRKAGLGYYQDACYHIFGRNEKKETIQLADGGTVNWLSQLLSSKKERMVTSGFGAELIQKRFNRK